jgi:hypothetical protein
MLLARRVEIWDNRQSAGGARLAVIPDDIVVQETRSVAAEESLACTIPILSAAASALLERRILRCDYSDTVFDEWRISQITERRTAAGELLLDVTGVPILQDLAEDCVVGRAEADGSVVYDFEALSLTPTQIINTFILPALTAEGITDVALGTIDPTAAVDVVFSWDTPLSALRKLAQVTSCELRLRRNGTSQYLVDLLVQIGAGATVPDLRFGKNLPWLTRDRNTVDFATRCQPQGAQTDSLYASMAGARWKVTAIAGTDITLADPAGGDPPIAFDNQLNGAYLRTVGGSLTLISASVASTQKVTVASAAGITVNDIIEFRKDSAGTALTWLTNPAAVTLYGRRVQVLPRPDLPPTINLIANPAERNYAGASSAPDGFETLGAPTLTRTSTPARWRVGGFSCRIQGTNDGDGIGTAYTTFAPTATLPYFSGFVSFWLEAGRVRVELIAAAATQSVTLTRSGTTVTVAYGGAHGLTAGRLVEILGANETQYNGIWVILAVPTSSTLTYTIATTPATPATGTITAAEVWRLPNGTEGRAWSDQTKTWVDLGVAGIDLNALAATRAKLRVMQDGTTATDCYADDFQLTQSDGQQSFLEGAGPTKLWQAANAYLVLHQQPAIAYSCAWLDLFQLDPTVWAFEDLTLGGAVNIRDEALNITAATRVLGYQRDVRLPGTVQLVLSTQPEDYTDQQLKPRLPPRKIADATIDQALRASALLLPLASTPTVVQARLAANVPSATLYYWLGDLGELPPPLTTVQAGSPTGTIWGTYSAPFTINRNQSVDLMLHVYARRGNQRSEVYTVVIDRDSTPSATLTLSEPVGGTLRTSFDPDDDTVWIEVYRKKNGAGNGYPTTDNNSTGPLDTAQKVASISVSVDGGGVDKSGNAIAGAAVPDETGYVNTDVVKVILVPMDRLGNVGARVLATRTMAGAVSPVLTARSVSRTNSGSACDTTNGVQYTFTWTPNAGVTNVGNDVVVSAMVNGTDEYTATEASPVTNTSKTLRIPYKTSSGKFDPTISVALSIRLLDSGGSVIQTEAITTDAFQSICGL